MKTGAALTLIGCGAILAFAVTAGTSVFDLNTAGYICILVGIAGLVYPRRRGKPRPGERAAEGDRPRHDPRELGARIRAWLHSAQGLSGDPEDARRSDMTLSDMMGRETQDEHEPGRHGTG